MYCIRPKEFETNNRGNVINVIDVIDVADVIEVTDVADVIEVAGFVPFSIIIWGIVYLLGIILLTLEGWTMPNLGTKPGLDYIRS